MVVAAVNLLHQSLLWLVMGDDMAVAVVIPLHQFCLLLEVSCPKTGGHPPIPRFSAGGVGLFVQEHLFSLGKLVIKQCLRLIWVNPHKHPALPIPFHLSLSN
jgi:hypothetical protein